MTPFEKRQYIRVSKRRRHQRIMAKIMRKAGGYNSFGWRTIVDRIRVRILRRIQFTQASKEAKASNEPVFVKDDRTGGGGAGA